MSCPEQTMLVRWMSGELSAQQRGDLEDHLSKCPACQALAAELRGVWAQLDAWQVAAPTDRIAARVLAAASQPQPRSRAMPLMRLAAAFLLSVTAGIVAGQLVASRTQLSAAPAPSEETVADSLGLDLWNEGDMIFVSLLEDPDQPLEPS